jgi:hypothetical protein
MVRKGGFEPPRLSAPPPQDGVSASSTTSATFSTKSFLRERDPEAVILNVLNLIMEASFDKSEPDIEVFRICPDFA